MLGCVLAMAFSASTVSLSDPMQQIWFLLMGWSVSIRPKVVLSAKAQNFAFERVFA
jgi:hypothetical protein